MPWYAQPSGGYAISSTEGTANILMANGFMNDKGYELEAQAGVLGNCYVESGLNPWRWQSDIVDLTDQYKGYGLFQFTPAYDYFNLRSDNIPGFAPNASTTYIESGANPSDGWAQFVVLDEDILHKWTTACWRNVASWNALESEYGWIRDTILNTYGNGSSLTYAQFKAIKAGTGGYSSQQAITFATFAFCACYEGPPGQNIQLSTRDSYSQEAYSILSGDTPPEPPSPTISRPHTMPFYLYFI